MCDPQEIEHGECDACGARVPLHELSMTTFDEGHGFTCKACERDTVILEEWPSVTDHADFPFAENH